MNHATETCFRFCRYKFIYIHLQHQAGGEYGSGGAYGSALIKVGQTEQKLGQAERDFINAAEMSFVQPLRQFLEGEMKTITREKGILESKRYTCPISIANYLLKNR